MADFPVNVKFATHPDGWAMDQEDDRFQSVQAGTDGEGIWFELWGTTTVISPAGKRYVDQRLQHNVWVRPNGDWKARRIIPDLLGDPSFEVRRGAIEFTLAGDVEAGIRAHLI